MRHRNTRRRPYRSFGYYFITTNVAKGFRILETMTFGLLAEHILHHAARLHDVNIIAYKINPDHVHLLCQIGAEGTISTFVAAWKRQFARQTNSILKRTPQLYATNSFKWQPSYHSHLITSKNDFSAHVNYILNQYKHHDLPMNNFVYWNKNHVFRFV